jgi:chromosome segregation ATPase
MNGTHQKDDNNSSSIRGLEQIIFDLHHEREKSEKLALMNADLTRAMETYNKESAATMKQLQDMLDESFNEKDQMNEEIESLQNLLQQKVNDIDELTKNNEDMNSLIESLRNEIQIKDKIIAHLHDKVLEVESLADDHSTTRSSLRSPDSKSMSMNASNHIDESYHYEIKEKLAIIQQQYNDLTIEYAAAIQSNEMLTNKYSSIRSEANEIKAKFLQLSLEMDRDRTENEQLKAELVDQRTNYNRKISSLQQELGLRQHTDDEYETMLGKYDEMKSLFQALSVERDSLIQSIAGHEARGESYQQLIKELENERSEYTRRALAQSRSPIKLSKELNDLRNEVLSLNDRVQWNSESEDLLYSAADMRDRDQQLRRVQSC